MTTRERLLEWAEEYKDSSAIGPHGIHDCTWGDIASTLLALEAERKAALVAAVTAVIPLEVLRAEYLKAPKFYANLSPSLWTSIQEGIVAVNHAVSES